MVPRIQLTLGCAENQVETYTEYPLEKLFLCLKDYTQLGAIG